MATYRVRLFRGDWFVIDVEADDEEYAVEEAFERAPYLCAPCSGWGQQGCVDEDGWQTPDEYFRDYTPERYGPVVERVEDE